MKKIIFLAAITNIISCKNKKTELENTFTETDNISKKIDDKIVIKPISVDTIKIQGKDDVLKEDYILANLLSKTYDKDSLITVKYRLDFYQNYNKVASDNVKISNYQEGSNWDAGYGLLYERVDKSPLIMVSNGYAACGYSQEKSLYSLENDILQLVHKWRTMSDSGWGVYPEFIPKSDALFYSHTILFSPSENSNNEADDIGTVEYSDSIKFEKKNNKWKKTYITPKDAVYRKYEQSFNDFHQLKK